MFPLDPMGNNRPDYRQQNGTHGQQTGTGKEALWVLGIIAGAIGVLAVVAAI